MHHEPHNEKPIPQTTIPRLYTSSDALLKVLRAKNDLLLFNKSINRKANVILGSKWGGLDTDLNFRWHFVDWFPAILRLYGRGNGVV